MKKNLLFTFIMFVACALVIAADMNNLTDAQRAQILKAANNKNLSESQRATLLKTLESTAAAKSQKSNKSSALRSRIPSFRKPQNPLKQNIPTPSSVSKSKKTSSVKPEQPTKKGSVVIEGPKDPEAKNITFDFSNTSLKVFAEFVAKLCDKILIGDEFLRGNVNLKSQRKMNVNEVKRLFGALLYSKNLDFIETENCLKVVQSTGSIVEVYNLKYLKSVDVAKSLTAIYRIGFQVGKNQQNVQISSIDDANAVVVLAPKKQQAEIEKSIKELDVRVRQVLLDVLLIEVTKSGTFGFGVSGQYTSPSAGSTNPRIQGGATNGGGGASFSNSQSPAAKYSYNFGRWSLGVNALDANTKLKILSQPRILATENQKSEIKIGQKQPYVNGSQSQNTGLDGSNATSSTTKTEDVGIDIKLTPRINKIGNVTLELQLSITAISNNLQLPVSYYENTAIYQTIPIIGYRTVNNTSVVKNGETLVIGGILDNTKTTTRTAPPGLGDIPWIGFLFSTTEEDISQKEIMLFVTPTVIENDEQLNALTKRETNKLRNYDPEEKETIDQMLTGKKSKTDDVFNAFDYFLDGEYRAKQDFIPQI